MDRPRLKAHLVPVITADEKVFLLTENDSFLIGGPAERAVMPLLDGRHTLADVAGTLATSQPLPAILGAIRKFERAGLLASGVSTLSQEQTAFFDAAAIDPAAAADRLNTSVVEVLALGNVDITGMVEALTVSGVTVSEVTASGIPANAVLQNEVPEYVDQESGAVGSEDIRLTVVVVDDYLNPALEELNRNMIARGRAWMLVKPAGSAAWFGPVFEPGVTACWGCLRERMDSNRMVEQYLRRFSGLEGHAVLTVAGLPSTRGAIEGLAASAVVRLLATGESMQLAGRIITLETDTFQTREHQVVRLPQCGVCGDPKVMHTDPKLELEVSAVAFTA
ncbi:MAG: TOMM precursor leader peptide-binding protein, partial [Actinomycetota bacterium]|nr:TOMM precursor leader peptide-binding protein [Actinomycetota bacterium]